LPPFLAFLLGFSAAAALAFLGLRAIFTPTNWKARKQKNQTRQKQQQ
jgi:hypothetical protein